MKLILILALALCACGQTSVKHKLPLPTDACKTQPNGDKVWYPDTNEFSPPGYPDGYQIQFDAWPAKCSKGKWITDEQRLREQQESRKPMDELLVAASSRLLSVEETKSLLNYGPYIFTHTGESYRQSDIERKFDNLLFLQKRFMLEAAKELANAK